MRVLRPDSAFDGLVRTIFPAEIRTVSAAKRDANVEKCIQLAISSKLPLLVLLTSGVSVPPEIDDDPFGLDDDAVPKRSRTSPPCTNLPPQRGEISRIVYVNGTSVRECSQKGKEAWTSSEGQVCCGAKLESSLTKLVIRSPNSHKRPTNAEFCCSGFGFYSQSSAWERRTCCPRQRRKGTQPTWKSNTSSDRDNNRRNHTRCSPTSSDTSTDTRPSDTSTLCANCFREKGKARPPQEEPRE